MSEIYAGVSLFIINWEDHFFKLYTYLYYPRYYTFAFKGAIAPLCSNIRLSCWSQPTYISIFRMCENGRF